ncbi:MAG: YgaP family membrane protein [Bacteroidota bacterium]
MKKNMGNADRIVRVLVAAAIAVLYFTNTATGTLAYILLAVGVIFLLTSLVGFCPLYSLFGINTCRVKNAGL